mgnify:FL=1
MNDMMKRVILTVIYLLIGLGIIVGGKHIYFMFDGKLIRVIIEVICILLELVILFRLFDNWDIDLDS